MAVIINEFEIVPQSPPSTPVAQPPAPAEAQTPETDEIIEQLRRQHQRKLRLRAY
jgi:hypothetical protein